MISAGFIRRAQQALIRRAFERTLDKWSSADSKVLADSGRKKLLNVFQDAARSTPAYQRVLARNGVSPSTITSVDEFTARVPILDKKQWFNAELREFCLNESLEHVAAYYSSSGQTGFFSYGMETRAEQKESALAVEFVLQQAFKVYDRKSLLINCLPMGVRIHTRSLPLADTSVREDVVLALLRKLSSDFEQFVLVGEHLFLKHLVEAGLSQTKPLHWPRHRVHVVTGGEYIAETFRSYLAEQLGIDLTDPNGGQIMVNFGLSEISASLAHENWFTIQIRRFAQENPAFKRALGAGEHSFCPHVMQFYPMRTFFETVETKSGPELVVTMLDPSRSIPIVRYNTGDRGCMLPYAKLVEVLHDFGRTDLVPSLRLPMLLLWGKNKCLLSAPNRPLYAEEVKEALYSDRRIAEAISGNFFLRVTEGDPEVALQLKPGYEPLGSFEESTARALNLYTSARPRAKMLGYREFDRGMRLDFERKFQYIDSANTA